MALVRPALGHLHARPSGGPDPPRVPAVAESDTRVLYLAGATLGGESEYPPKRHLGRPHHGGDHYGRVYLSVWRPEPGGAGGDDGRAHGDHCGEFVSDCGFGHALPRPAPGDAHALSDHPRLLHRPVTAIAPTEPPDS